jgi:small subunit ribosomal protein S16
MKKNMLKIRLKVKGRKKRPFYQIVLVHQRSRRDGAVIQELGYYDPFTKYCQIDQVETIKRIDQGAQLSEVVTNLLRKASIVQMKTYGTRSDPK